MNLTEVINFIEDGNYESYVIVELSRSLRKKLSDEYAKNSDLEARLRAIKKINDMNKNPSKRRKGIASLCAEEEQIEKERQNEQC